MKFARHLLVFLTTALVVAVACGPKGAKPATPASTPAPAGGSSASTPAARVPAAPTPPSEKSLGVTHSDLAFTGKYAIQGNYNGFEIWDISNPAKPVLANAYTCPASQNDVSVYKNLLFMSSESTSSRADCGFGGVPD